MKSPTPHQHHNGLIIYGSGGKDPNASVKKYQIHMLIEKNKWGEDVEWTQELDADMRRIHGVCVRTLVQNIWGTKFNVMKTPETDVNGNVVRYVFTLRTNSLTDIPTIIGKIEISQPSGEEHNGRQTQL